MIHRRAVLIVMAMIALASVSDGSSSARSELELFFTDATAALARAGDDPKQARDDVRERARGLFDVRSAARQALGAEWDDRTAAERDEFARTFGDVFELAYVKMVEARLPHDRLPVIRIVGERTDGPRDALVRTNVEARDGSDVKLDYVMTRLNESWRVRDVVIDGVSLVENYRAQFARVLRDSTYHDLADRLRAVADTGGAEAMTTSPRTGAPPNVAVAYFATAGSTLDDAARRELDDTAAWLAANERARVVVDGHADQRGDPQLNRTLAARRAAAVREYLVDNGIDRDRIVIVVHGDEQPACRERTEECWAQNRRAVVRVTA